MGVSTVLFYCRRGMRRFGGLFDTDMAAAWYFLDFYLYPPLALLCLAYALWASPQSWWLAALGLAMLGYVSWTLVEYLAHRFLLHHVGVFRRLHEAHHADPESLIGTPTLISIGFFAVFAYGPAALAFGTVAAAAWMAGLLAGYLAYVTVHYLVHHEASRGYRLLRRLKRQHARHHHVATDRHFGVTTAFWDRLFGTG